MQVLRDPAADQGAKRTPHVHLAGVQLGFPPRPPGGSGPERRAERGAGACRRGGVEGVEAAGVGAALHAAEAQAGAADLVLVTGSLFVVAEALEAWFSIPGEHYPEFDPQAAVVTRGPA